MSVPTSPAVPAGLLDRVRRRLVEAAGPELVPSASAAAVAEAAGAEGVVLGVADRHELVSALQAELVGAGPLAPLLRRAGVTDVLVNGPGEVWVDDGAGLRRAEAGIETALGSEATVRALATRLAAGAGRRLDEASPWVDARLPDGTRLHAVLPPLARAGTHLSLRVPARRRLALVDLVRAGTVAPDWVPVLTGLLRAGRSLLVSGGTGAGKTTLLQALLGEVGRGERIVLVEDSAELDPDHPHVVRLQARHGNVEGHGAVTLDQLVRQALRMRPDRLVVGECRGAEVRDLLAAMNTGHAGAGTVHANTAADVVARLHALASAAGMTPQAVDLQLLAGVDVVLHVARRPSGRRLVAIAVVAATAAGGVEVRTAVELDADGRSRPGPGWERLDALSGDDGSDPC
ncbi:TadA family conjugal transfer-associated ATPase [Kineococcus gynurae]|uniref:TadA family conjugal transfer-associated ATPase n=1 Tax=Kineococcus gynurae TaxID=452979 RepID=A0ABV5LTX4_9ACTN